MGGILYGVGIGPGDSELITLKALRIISENNILAVPRTKNKNNTALDIVSKVIDVSQKEIIYIDFGMISDKKLLKEQYKNNANTIEKYLAEYKNVVFISIGDISIYSTYGYIDSIIKSKGYKTEMVAGVPSFCAVSSALGISLTNSDKPIHIIPAIYSDIEKYIDMDGTKIFMKSGKKIEDIKKTLLNKKLSSYAVYNCGLYEEKIFKDINDIEGNLGYFTTVIVKEE